MATSLVSDGVRFPDESVQGAALPSGCAIFWGDSIINLPDGWSVCDGTNGTPDFRDYFVVGAGGLYPFNSTGGSTSETLTAAQLPVHSHPVSDPSLGPDGAHNHPSPSTNTTGDHTHPGTAIRSPGGNYGGTGGTFGPKPSTTGSANNHSHPASVGSSGAHSHPGLVATTAVGANDPHENMPPYYALAIIMETGSGEGTTSLVSTGVRFPGSSIQRRRVPPGTLVLWPSTSPPTGWAMCDGLNGTPDLTDRFLVCAGPGYPEGSSGGASEVHLSAPQLPEHTHSLEVASTPTAGAHTHPVSFGTNPAHTHPAPGKLQSGPGIAVASSPATGSAQPNATLSPSGSHNHDVTISPAGAHTHPVTLTLEEVGEGAAHNNLPPYRAWYFIMLLP